MASYISYYSCMCGFKKNSVNLHACNIPAVAMIATVNTTAITITLAAYSCIAVYSYSYSYTPAG